MKKAIYTTEKFLLNVIQKVSATDSFTEKKALVLKYEKQVLYTKNLLDLHLITCI